MAEETKEVAALKKRLDAAEKANTKLARRAETAEGQVKQLTEDLEAATAPKPGGKAQKRPAHPVVEYVAAQDFDWCGLVYKSGETVGIGNPNLAADLLRRKVIKEK